MAVSVFRVCCVRSRLLWGGYGLLSVGNAHYLQDFMRYHSTMYDIAFMCLAFQDLQRASDRACEPFAVFGLYDIALACDEMYGDGDARERRFVDVRLFEDEPEQGIVRFVVLRSDLLQEIVRQPFGYGVCAACDDARDAFGRSSARMSMSRSSAMSA